MARRLLIVAGLALAVAAQFSASPRVGRSSAMTMLSLTVASGRGGATFGVRGSGFAANEWVSLAFDGTAIASAPATAAGALPPTTLTIPTSASPGWHSVSATGAASALAAQSAFLVIGPLRGQVEDVGFWSKALQSRINVGVYLPPGYENGAQRYPVVYFLHGLPAHETAYRSHVRFAAAYVEALSKAALVVVPQAARVGDNDPEYLDWGLGRNWETAISVELPRFVDTRFRTVAERRGRALVGLSAGGYGAVLSGLHHLRTFGVLESWGGYFRPTDPSGKRTLDLGSDAANRRASAFTLVPTLKASFAREPTWLAFFVGQQDTRFLRDNVNFNAALLRAHVPHRFALYPGAHSGALWASQAGPWLASALDRLAAPVLSP